MSHNHVQNVNLKPSPVDACTTVQITVNPTSFARRERNPRTFSDLFASPVRSMLRSTVAARFCCRALASGALRAPTVTSASTLTLLPNLTLRMAYSQKQGNTAPKTTAPSTNVKKPAVELDDDDDEFGFDDDWFLDELFGEDGGDPIDYIPVQEQELLRNEMPKRR